MPFARALNWSLDKFGTLRFRLMMLNTAVNCLLLFAIMVGANQLLRVSLVNEIDQHLLDELEEMQTEIQRLYPNREVIQQLLNTKGFNHRNRSLFVRIFDQNGKLLLSSEGAPDEIAPVSAFNGQVLLTAGGSRLAQSSVRIDASTIWTLRVGEAIRSVDVEVGKIQNQLLLIGGLVLALSPLAGYWLAARATQPIAEIIKTANRLRPGTLGDRLEIRGTGDELDRLCKTINGLFDRIAQYVSQNRQFTSNAAHELRSPLAAIQSSIEVTLCSVRTPDTYQEVLGDVLAECESLRTLINQLLLLAESDAGQLHPGQESVRLEELVGRTVDMFRSVAETRGIELSAEVAQPISIRGDPYRLKQVLNNLVDNALKFTPDGGRVFVELRRVPGQEWLQLRVVDSGHGIAERDLRHIFERFYRSDFSRQRTGNGLGLSICAAIIQSYHGRITVSSKEGVGTTFSVRLPLDHTAVSDADMPATDDSGVGAVFTR